MKAIGVRAEKDCFHWVLVTGTASEPAYIDRGDVRAPKAYGEAESLSFFRERLLSLVDAHGPDIIALKRPETFGRGNRNVSSIDSRLRVEGVLLEAAHSAGVAADGYQWRQVSKRMGADSAKLYAQKKGPVREIELDVSSPSVREALFVAIAALGE